jgi:hypothetical protein
MQESPIFVKSYDLLQWLLPQLTKFPKSQRFMLAERIGDVAMDFYELILEAALASEKAALLAQADLALAKLRFYIRLSKDLKFLSPQQYAHCGRLIAEVGRLLGGWIKKQSVQASVGS